MTNSEMNDSYSLLRSALAIFKKPPSELSNDEMTAVTQQAANEYDIELRVLSSTEAAGVVIPEQTLDDAVQQIQSRFDDEASFNAALEANNLDLASLRQSLQRQCKVENVLEIVGARAVTISDVEVSIFYHMHPEKFRSPEQRNVSHILITINNDYAENTREKARERIHEIANKLIKKPYKFSDLAMQHSECPSSLDGGVLGTFPQGKLYPEIDAALFTLKKGAISEIIETEVGFHIIKCNKITPVETISIKKATPKIRQLMHDRAKRNCQRAWLANLPSLEETKTTNTNQRHNHG